MRALLAPVESSADFLSEWERIYALSDAGVFLSPAWIGALIDAAPAETQFHVLTVLDDLRGAYGIALVSAPQRRLFPAPRAAHFNESGVPALDRIYIEYNDLLLSRIAPAGAREEAVRAILDADFGGDQIVFRNLRPALAHIVENAGTDLGLDVEILGVQPTFAIDLASAGDAGVIEGFTSALRAKIRRSIRRYEERGEVRIERAETAADRAVAWTELIRLHTEVWSRRGDDGAFRNGAARAFHEKLIEDHTELIDLVRLKAGNETIGVLYNFIARGVASNYQSGFRYEADNQLAPGFVAHALAAEAYRANGFATYDLLAGDAGYKRRLGKEGERLTTIALTRKSFRMRARRMLKSPFASHDAKTRQT